MREITDKSVIKIVDVRPDDCHKKGDCTTRCLTYCLNSNYWTIRQEQDETSIRKCGEKNHWNYEEVWTDLLLKRGWKKITLKRKMARFNLSKVVGHINCRFATHSSHHAAAMDRGNVIDNWNSEGGRVDYIIVPPNHYEEFFKLVGPCFKELTGNNKQGENEMKKQNEETPVENIKPSKEKTSAEKMMAYLKAINHNEKMILRLEAKIQKLTDANDKLRAEFKKAVAE